MGTLHFCNCLQMFGSGGHFPVVDAMTKEMLVVIDQHWFSQIKFQIVFDDTL